MDRKSLNAWKSAVLLAGAVAFGCSTGHVQAQAAKAPAAASAGASGFSIETEMLTYRALESNSEAIACDVAGYLYHSPADFKTADAGVLCKVKSGTRKVSVLVTPFDQATFAEFNVWRGDMATMDRLLDKAGTINCPAGVHKAGVASAASAAGSLLTMLTPAGPPMAMTQAALALLSSSQEVSATGGNIGDQAFVDGVARELRALQVRVILPTAYAPYSLTQMDETSSPFMKELKTLMAAEGCLKRLKTQSPPAESTQGDVESLIVEIDAFRATFGDTASSATAASGAGAAAGGAKPAGGSTAAPVVNMSHMAAVIAGDGLAQALGIGADGQSPETETHILLLRALESGGSVERRTNVLGTKIRYSGGSVGTYALFNVDGDLECSGNAYRYAGSVSAKNFDAGLRKYNPEPGSQVLFLRGGCSAK